MIAKKSWLYAALISICGMGAASYFLRTPSQTWIPIQTNDGSLSIHNPQQLLSHLDIVDDKLRLHSDWYGLLSPIQLVVTNGVIRNIQTKLLWDTTKPIILAGTWSGKDTHIIKPILTASLFSMQGQTGAQNLATFLSGYLTVEETDHTWNTQISLPSLPTISLSWMGTQQNILMVGSLHKQQNFDRSLFTKTTTAIQTSQLHLENPHPVLSSAIETFDFSIHTEETIIAITGKGVWKGESIPEFSAPPNMLAGISITGLPAIQIHKQETGELCFAGNAPHIQKALNIDTTCPLKSTTGMFAFVEEPVFTHIDIPISKMVLQITQKDEENISIDGSIIKKEPRGLFPLYRWIYQSFFESM